MRYRDLRGVLASSVAVMAVAVATPAMAQIRSFDIPAQSAATGIPALAKQADIQLLVSSAAVTGKKIRAIRGQMTVDEAIRRAVGDADLQIVNSDGRTYTLAPRERRRTTSMLEMPAMRAVEAQNQAAPQYDEIIVTAQKKEERITDVPIAMSAFSAEALDDYKIEGGSELLRAIPNVNFSKSNFSMYNFSIRGIGTKAISASSDPAVAVSFNNTPLVRNRLFESEFFDMARIEVLRGPQGTLYGRNATGGVTNLISNLPTQEFTGEVKGETGNYKSRRLSGMLNIPLSDALAIRVAAMMTKRDGYDFNSYTGEQTNGRDLWSTRATAKWEPSERLNLNFVWQRFAEDDNRSRTGKQLCHRDEGPESVAGITLTDPFIKARFSQGCKPGSLYDDAAFGAPSGYSLAYLWAAQNIVVGFTPAPPRLGPAVTALKPIDPYGNVIQSRNLREISTSYDPKFKVKNNIFQLNLKWNVSDDLLLVSQGSYADDAYFSTQDYNRYASDILFNSSTVPLVNFRRQAIDTELYPGATPDGKFCDPQLGCSDRLLSADISQSKNRQWYQEFRIQSSFDGNLNFNIGANYLDFKSKDDYYVFNNLFTMVAQYFYGEEHPVTRVTAPIDCPLGYEEKECIYIDPNPIGSLNNQGHNYFLSQNGVRTKSRAIFGELYFEPTDDLKVTLGARYTNDRKVSTQIPSQVLLAGGVDGPAPGSNTGGRVNSGYPRQPDIRQSWDALTGRLVIDWKPYVSGMSDVLIYGSASRGYKGGGTNPPRMDINPDLVKTFFLPQTFRPERINALELGMKNSFLNGRGYFNITAFYYDYKGYQISQIVDRIAYNENFDVENWGLEIEGQWRPTARLKLDANLGYLRTRLKAGQESLDVMNRTQGNPDWVVLRPWLQAPSNCIAPRAYVEQIIRVSNGGNFGALAALCPTSSRLGDFNPDTTDKNKFENLYGFTYDPLAPYDPDKVGAIVPYDPANPTAWRGMSSGAPNQGRGFFADISGNELPNSPRFTFNFGAEYRIPLDGRRWELSIRGDYYRQSKSYARVYNTTHDVINGWDNFNAQIELKSNDNDLTFQFYVKNIFNKDSITDSFINSDDTGLTTNIFLVDPRIYGLSVSKKF